MMRSNKTWVYLVSIVQVLLFCSNLASSETSKTDRNKISPEQQEAWTKELMAVLLEIKNAILKNDVKQLLKYIDGEGMFCTDEHVPFAEIKRDLNDKNSKLHLSLFETERFVKECGNKYGEEYPPISEREFFMKAKDLEIDISPIESDWTIATISSSVKQHYPRRWLFHRTKGKWKLSDGFILRCSCG